MGVQAHEQTSASSGTRTGEQGKDRIALAWCKARSCRGEEEASFSEQGMVSAHKPQLHHISECISRRSRRISISQSRSKCLHVSPSFPAVMGCQEGTVQLHWSKGLFPGAGGIQPCRRVECSQERVQVQQQRAAATCRGNHLQSTGDDTGDGQDSEEEWKMLWDIEI